MERGAPGAVLSAAPSDELTILFGVQRSAILRFLGDAPATCGRIAQAVYLVPGGVTHHLRALEAAGLIRRTRAGRHVMVELTARGHTLQTLFPQTPGAFRAARS